jgi:hypothetical protein
LCCLFVCLFLLFLFVFLVRCANKNSRLVSDPTSDWLAPLCTVVKLSRTGEPARVIRWAREKVAQNVAQFIFVLINTSILPWKEISPNICATPVIFTKTAQSTHSAKRRKFAQSGHPGTVPTSFHNSLRSACPNSEFMSRDVARPNYLEPILSVCCLSPVHRSKANV